MQSVEKGIVQIVISVPILVGNGMILKYLYVRTRCNILLLNLTCANLFVGIVMPGQAISSLNTGIRLISNICIFRFSSMVLVSFASLFAVLLTAIDRLVCVYQHEKYPVITIRKTVIAIFVSWLNCVLLTMCPIATDTYIPLDNGTDCFPTRVYFGFIPAQYVVILFVMCVMYLQLSRIATAKKRQIITESNLVLNSRMMKSQNELRAAKFMAVILVVLMLCWTPFATTLIVQSATEGGNENAIKVAEIVAFLGVVNSLVNPIVYPLQNRRFRRAFEQMFGRLKQHF